MKLFLTILLSSVSLIHAADAEVRWNSKFKETYESQAEGSGMSFAVRVYNPRNNTRIVILLE